MRPALSASLAILIAGATLVAACEPTVDPVSTPAPGQATGAPGVTDGPVVTPAPDTSSRREPNVITGRVTTETGQPVAGAELRIVGYTGGASLGQEIETVVSDTDGVYRYEVPTGLYEVLGEGPLEFGGETYLFSLDPVDGDCGMQESSDGIVKDFVLRLTGLMQCYDGVDPENYLFYHGANVQLLASLPSAAPNDVVEYRFEPIDAFADGSAGQSFALQRTVAAHANARGSLDGTWVLHDLPLADYTVSAALLRADGSEQPLLLSTQADPMPAASVSLDFPPRLIVGELAVGYQMPTLYVEAG